MVLTRQLNAGPYRHQPSLQLLDVISDRQDGVTTPPLVLLTWSVVTVRKYVFPISVSISAKNAPSLEDIRN